MISDQFAASALPWLISVPLLGALASLVAGRAGRVFALAALFANAALGVGLVLALNGGAMPYAVGGWRAPLGIELQASGLSALLVATSGLLCSAVGWYALDYFASAAHQARYFWPLVCLLLTALDTLFLARDAFTLYVGLELLSLSAVALVSLAGTLDALCAALRYLLVSLIGSLCYLMGVALVYRAYAVLELAQLASMTGAGALDQLALALMTAGLALKTALFPLHFWLPQAHANAPAPVSALLSGLVLKGSFYVIVQLWFAVMPKAATDGAHVMLGALGCAGVLWGATAALGAARVKLVVAYSSVAQIGYFFMLFALLKQQQVSATAFAALAYFMLAHACAKAAAFLAAGNIQTTAGHDRIAELRGQCPPSALAFFAFAIAGVSLIGLPPTGGFLAKWLLLKAAFAGQAAWLVWVAVIGGLLAGGYVFRILALSFHPAGPPAPTRLPLSRSGPPLVLALCALLLGLMAAPLIAFLEAAPLASSLVGQGGMP